MFKMFRNKKDDKLTDLLIMLLEDGGLEGFAEKQAKYIVLEQAKVATSNDNNRVLEKYHFLQDQKDLGLVLDNSDEKEYKYVAHLVKYRGLIEKHD